MWGTALSPTVRPAFTQTGTDERRIPTWTASRTLVEHAPRGSWCVRKSGHFYDLSHRRIRVDRQSLRPGSVQFTTLARRENACAEFEMSAAMSSTKNDVDRELSTILATDSPNVVTVSKDLNTVTPDLTVIIPHPQRGREYRPPAGRALDAALGAVSTEIIFVDDSDDDTVEAIDRARQRHARSGPHAAPRPARARSGGLSTAVVTGMQAARAPWALVMDGDLQHPPEVVPSCSQRRAGTVRTWSWPAGMPATGSSRGSRRRGRRRQLAARDRGCQDRLPAPAGPDQRPDERVLRRPAGRARPRPPPAVRLQDPARAHRSDAPAAHRRGHLPLPPRYGGESKTSFREVLRFGRHLARLRLQIARERSDASRREPARRSRMLLFGLSGSPASSSTRLALWLLDEQLLAALPGRGDAGDAGLDPVELRAVGPPGLPQRARHPGLGPGVALLPDEQPALLLRLPAARGCSCTWAWRSSRRT